MADALKHFPPNNDYSRTDKETKLKKNKTKTDHPSIRLNEIVKTWQNDKMHSFID